mmetsp:Transcript_60840/g.170096  ORF Transcript_60840/g.170096 Transcript_60840/m.170096 type:complete len:238 (+) Transcript_60840:1127-1840(+)
MERRGGAQSARRPAWRGFSPDAHGRARCASRAAHRGVVEQDWRRSDGRAAASRPRRNPHCRVRQRRCRAHHRCPDLRSLGEFLVWLLVGQRGCQHHGRHLRVGGRSGARRRRDSRRPLSRGDGHRELLLGAGKPFWQSGWRGGHWRDLRRGLRRRHRVGQMAREPRFLRRSTKSGRERIAPQRGQLGQGSLVCLPRPRPCLRPRRPSRRSTAAAHFLEWRRSSAWARCTTRPCSCSR